MFLCACKLIIASQTHCLRVLLKVMTALIEKVWVRIQCFPLYFCLVQRVS